ncbi:hypothetical protein LTR53_011174 [Teratosphaeriaceae sp. CCFEE 6253]|nr:hypothetical protein LTR53_011174 [Teratosphaeriaceae sp. CCFEE 6253]
MLGGVMTKLTQVGRECPDGERVLDAINQALTTGKPRWQNDHAATFLALEHWETSALREHESRSTCSRSPPAASTSTVSAKRNYYEEAWEFDLDTLVGLDVKTCTPAMYDDLVRLGKPMPLGRGFGRIEFAVRGAGSAQAAYVDAARRDQSYVIYVDITKPHHQQAFHVYITTILPARSLSYDGLPRDDWYATRDDQYCADAISRYQLYRAELPPPTLAGVGPG